MVDPGTWHDACMLGGVSSMSMSWDLDDDMLGDATIECAEQLGEVYVRAYAVVTQNGETARECLGTFLAQSSESSFDGKVASHAVDCYTPLKELGESSPEIGYTTPGNDFVEERAMKVARQHMRAPVTASINGGMLCGDFTSNLDDTWLTFARDLLAMASKRLMVGPRGDVYAQPVGDAASMRPVCTFDDGNSSILMPDVTLEHDVWGIPNVVEVVYGNQVARAVNDDADSPISTVSRGREVVARITSPDLSDRPSDEEALAYAVAELRNRSVLTHTVTFRHGYVPGVWLGDCVRLEYTRAGIYANAVIRSRSIDCSTELTVEEVATYTERMWR